MLFGKLKKGGTVKVTVAPDGDGKPGLKLEAIPDKAPAKPRKETPAKRKSAAAKAKDGDAGPEAASEPKKSGSVAVESKTEPQKPRGGTVPKVPRKK